VLVQVHPQLPQQLRLLHLVRQRPVLRQQLLVGQKEAVVQQQLALLQHKSLEHPARAAVSLGLAQFFIYHFKSIMNHKNTNPTQLQ
jgi:hypothetical protein